MGRNINKALFGFLSLAIVQSMVFALDSEYKNTLVKVELTKTSDSAYSVNLYTRKNFSEPVKIIKKSDLNYYILLPETKNNAAQTASNSSDIKNITTNSYPYAGQDLNNGYTKINISTTKPINFSLNVKSAQTQVAKTPSSEKITLAQGNAKAAARIKEEKIEKKNPVSTSAQKTQTAQKTAINSSKNQITLKQPIKETSKQTQKTVQKPAAKATQKVAQAQKAQKDTVQKPKEKIKTVQTPATKPKEAPKQIAQAAPQEIKTVQKAAKIEDIIKEEVEKAKNEANVATNDDFSDSPLKEDDYATLNPDDAYIAQNTPPTDFSKLDDQIPDEFIDNGDKSIFSKIKNAISNIILDYGLGFGDLVLIAIVAIISFFTALVLLTKKSRPQARIRSKSDLIINTEKTPALTPKTRKKPVRNIPTEAVEQEDKGQYFVFDDNIKQTGFYDPATTVEQKNYELSSYDPELNDEYKKESALLYTNDPTSNVVESEYDIIQKILKEDTYTEVAPGEFEENNTKQSDIIKESEAVSSPIKKQAEIKEENFEPIMRSKAEIAPERGFMCISYNDNISLVGYIFDDVFALHNFKQSELEDYDIKFRLSEKDGKGANFIVKVNGTKMLIRVTKSSMNLEVVM